MPVKLYSAVSREDDPLQRAARVRRRPGPPPRVAEGTDEEVPYEEIVKGYEITKDRYVTVSRDELAELDPKKTRAIEIQDFVEIGEIDPIYFESPYYLGPAEGAEKAYSLLGQRDGVLGQGGDRPLRPPQPEHLAAIRASEGVLTLTTMRFADEVVAPAELEDVLPQEKPKVAARRRSRWRRS